MVKIIDLSYYLSHFIKKNPLLDVNLFSRTFDMESPINLLEKEEEEKWSTYERPYKFGSTYGRPNERTYEPHTRLRAHKSTHTKAHTRPHTSMGAHMSARICAFF